MLPLVGQRLGHCSILIGAPCSGKTTKCSTLIGQWTVISRDDIRTRINGKYHHMDPNTEHRVSDIFNKELQRAYQERQNIVIDTCGNKYKYINNYLSILKDYKIIFVYFEEPLYKLVFRNIKRYLKTGKWVPIGVIFRMRKECKQTWTKLSPVKS